MTRLYLAGPMSGLPELNFPAFHAEAARLRTLGHDIVNPAEINADPSSGWHACMRADIRELMTCDGIALMTGWANSKGARIECRLALDLGMIVCGAYAIDGCESLPCSMDFAFRLALSEAECGTDWVPA